MAEATINPLMPNCFFLEKTDGDLRRLAVDGNKSTDNRYNLLATSLGNSPVKNTQWRLEPACNPGEASHFFGIRLADSSRNVLLGADGKDVHCRDWGQTNGGDNRSWIADPRYVWEIRTHSDSSDPKKSGYRFLNGETGGILFTHKDKNPQLLYDTPNTVHQDQVWQFKTDNNIGVNFDKWIEDNNSTANTHLEKSVRLDFDTHVLNFHHNTHTWKNNYINTIKNGIISRIIANKLQIRNKSSVMVFIHGVNSDFNSFSLYIDHISRLFDQHEIRDERGRPLSRNDLIILGIEWPSQNMGEMLKSLLTAGEKMSAQSIAEDYLKDTLLSISAGLDSRFHFVSHSMGAQVLLYLLPQIGGKNIPIGSLFFIQGFAQASAFMAPNDKSARIPKPELWVAQANYLLKWFSDSIGPKALDSSKSLLGIIARLKLDDIVRPENVKRTEFSRFAEYVLGPIMATRTRAFWSDFQLGAAALSLYEPSHALGAHGFVNDNTKTVALHLNHENIYLGGNFSYDFIGPLARNEKYFNLDIEPYISNHDDFKNSATAHAHLTAINWIGAPRKPANKVVPLAEQVIPRHWMADTWETIKHRKLTELCLPGAHDAGTAILSSVKIPSDKNLYKIAYETISQNLYKRFYELWKKVATDESAWDDLTKSSAERAREKAVPFDMAHSITGGVAKVLAPTASQMLEGLIPSLTRTQERPIGDQLRRGCRFFDMRPVIGPNGEHFLAHGDQSMFGIVGAYGEQLKGVLDDVLEFASAPEHRRELIILMFSHTADWDGDKNALTNDQKRELVDLITQKLAPVLINRFKPEERLDDLPLEDLLQGDRNVLCLLDRSILEEMRLVPAGAYTFLQREQGDGELPTDLKFGLVLFDHYANSRNTANVIDDQLIKFEARMAKRETNAEQKDLEARRRGQEVFLLSWTATLALNASLGDLHSVIGLAKAHNAHLKPFVTSAIARGIITSRRRPNIIYVDAYDSSVLDVVTMINALPVTT